MTTRPQPSNSRSTLAARAVFSAALATGLHAFSGVALAAAPAGVSTGGCEVIASGQLRGSEYRAQYEGACKNGLAHGEGKAIWQSNYAPDSPPVVWQGRFTQGIFLAERESVGAQRIDSTRALLDLGPLKATGSAKPGNLWVESRVDGKLPASVCQPLSLQVSAQGDLSDDALTKRWLDSAYDRWFAVCKQAAVDKLKGRNLRMLVHNGNDWKPDSYGNFPPGVAQATKPFGTSSVDTASSWSSYSNSAAQQKASAQRNQAQSEELQANQARIQKFASKTGAKQIVELKTLESNPFRFGKNVILVAVRMEKARTPVEAFVRSANGSRYDWSSVLLRGPISDWDEQGRIVAVRVNGRSTDKETLDYVILELVDSQRCEQSNCEDYLLMPGKRWLRDDVFHAGVNTQPPLVLAGGKP